MFVDLFEDVVDKNTLQIKNYELAYKLKRYLEFDVKFNAYADSRDMGIMDYVSCTVSVHQDRKDKPALLNSAIELLKNDVPIKITADITELDFRLIEILYDLNSDCESQEECKIQIEERYEIAGELSKLSYLKIEDIAKKTKLTVEEVAALRKKE